MPYDPASFCISPHQLQLTRPGMDPTSGTVDLMSWAIASLSWEASPHQTQGNEGVGMQGEPHHIDGTTLK